MDRPIAEPLLAMTLSQQLAMLHQEPQTHPQLNPQQRGTRDPEIPEDLEGCALFSAPNHFHLGGFLQRLKPATQEFPASIAGHGQNVSPPDSVARSHEDHASAPRHLFGRSDKRSDSVCQLHQKPQSRRTNLLRPPLTPSSFWMCVWISHDDGSL